ncbi:MAG: hydrogenase formation protein HypD [Desulfurococcaceae archaeon]
MRVFRDRVFAKGLIERIKQELKEVKRERGLEKVRIMNFCGTHEWTITHYGLRSVLPPEIELIPGPGCPVCITPGYYVDVLIDLCLNEKFTVLTYGDAFKLPGSKLKYPRNLMEAKAIGGDVKVVYSFTDALRNARENRGKVNVFFAIGFETTMPSTAIPTMLGILPENLLLLLAYRYTPPVMRHLLDRYPQISLNGIIAPGHVSTIIGSNAWEFIPIEHGIPVVVAGFEPLDVIISVYYILKMMRGKPMVINEYSRVVKPWGNVYAKKAIETVYEPVNGYWRGIGEIPRSGVKHREVFAKNDLFTHLEVESVEYRDDKLPGCLCDKVVLGLVKPTQCPLFMKTCTPVNPYGPCMVSSEGTCRIWAEHSAWGLQSDVE